MKKGRIGSTLIVAMALLLIATTVVHAGGNNPGVLPPNSRVQGMTYGDWIAQWWKFALELPLSQNPIAGGTNCAYQRVGNVALVVANSLLDEPIQCEVPAGTLLYIEVLGAECSTLEPPPFYGGDERELRACVHAIVPEELQASIDGVPVRNLDQYIFTSPMVGFTEPEDNILGVPAGSTGYSVGYGAYLLIAPLSPGKHTLYTHGFYPDFDFTANRVIDLTVKP